MGVMDTQLTIDSAATLWSLPEGARAGKPALVLLHGYGADEHDLFGLVPHLPAHLSIAAVAAPLRPGPRMPGRSWYPIEGLEDRDPAAISRAAQALLDWIDKSLPDAPQVALLGFSQGAAVSLQALRLDPTRFTTVVALSGYAPEGESTGDAQLREQRPPVFWGRGTLDQVIPAPLITHTAEWLPQHTDLTEHVYPGLAHGISEDELRDIIAFLHQQLPDTAN